MHIAPSLAERSHEAWIGLQLRTMRRRYASAYEEAKPMRVIVIILNHLSGDRRKYKTRSDNFAVVTLNE